MIAGMTDQWERALRLFEEGVISIEEARQMLHRMDSADNVIDVHATVVDDQPSTQQNDASLLTATKLPFDAIAIRRGTDCSEHLVMRNGVARCGFNPTGEDGHGWLDAPEDDDQCDWEPCPRCYESGE